MNVILLTGISGIIFQRSIGAYQLAHNLREHGITCQVIDFIYDFSDDELQELIEKFISNDTFCIGISTTFLSGIKVGLDNKSKLPLIIPKHVENCIVKLKTKYPTIKICIGGSKSKECSDLNWVDAIFHGYSEDNFLDFCIKNKEKKSNPFITKINNKEIYNKENFVFDIEKLNHKFSINDCITKNETLPIEISRGCIFKCKFCAYPLNGKKKLDYIRSPKEIADELKFNYENYGTVNYFFADDTFNDSVIKLDRLNNEIQKLPFNINFTCYLRLDLLYAHREMIDILKNMGLLTAFFGIESFCQESLSAIGKNIKVEKIKSFLDELYFEYWKEKINFSLGFIIGLPKETKDNILETVNWLSQRPYSFHFEPLRLKDAGGYYTSEFQRNKEKYGYKLDNENFWYTDQFNEKDAENLANVINNEFAYKKNKASSWVLMAMLNHFQLDKILSCPVSEIKYKEILQTRKKRINEYKRLLLE